MSRPDSEDSESGRLILSWMFKSQTSAVQTGPRRPFSIESSDASNLAQVDGRGVARSIVTLEVLKISAS